MWEGLTVYDVALGSRFVPEESASEVGRCASGPPGAGHARLGAGAGRSGQEVGHSRLDREKDSKGSSTSSCECRVATEFDQQLESLPPCLLSRESAVVEWVVGDGVRWRAGRRVAAGCGRVEGEERCEDERDASCLLCSRFGTYLVCGNRRSTSASKLLTKNVISVILYAIVYP